MVYCCVPYCNSKQGKTKYVTFHEFPCEETLREKWIKNISRKDSSGDLWRPADRSVVCSRHFEKSSYKEGCKIRVLKKDSVPTVFEDYSDSVELNSQTQKRQVKKLKLSNEIVNSENNTNKCHTAANSLEILAEVCSAVDRRYIYPSSKNVILTEKVKMNNFSNLKKSSVSETKLVPCKFPSLSSHVELLQESLHVCELKMKALKEKNNVMQKFILENQQDQSIFLLE